LRVVAQELFDLGVANCRYAGVGSGLRARRHAAQRDRGSGDKRDGAPGWPHSSLLARRVVDNHSATKLRSPGPEPRLWMEPVTVNTRPARRSSGSPRRHETRRMRQYRGDTADDPDRQDELMLERAKF